MNTAQRLTHLRRSLPLRSYLEIGVSKGATFRNVTFERKFAVDPHFRFRYKNTLGEMYYETTSDAYFAGLNDDVIFDCVFIDGLHHWEQALRDFDNTLQHTHANSLIVIDDVYPCDEFSILRSQEKAVAMRLLKAPGVRHANSWHGDVFKAAFMIAYFYPDISFVTIDEGFGNPQMLCWRKDRERMPAGLTAESIERLDYPGFLRYKGVLNLRSEEEALALVVRELGRG